MTLQEIKDHEKKGSISTVVVEDSSGPVKVFYVKKSKDFKKASIEITNVKNGVKKTIKKVFSERRDGTIPLHLCIEAIERYWKGYNIQEHTMYLTVGVGPDLKKKRRKRVK